MLSVLSGEASCALVATSTVGGNFLLTSGILDDNIRLSEINLGGGAEVVGDLTIWWSKPTAYFHVGLQRDDLDWKAAPLLSVVSLSPSADFTTEITVSGFGSQNGRACDRGGGVHFLLSICSCLFCTVWLFCRMASLTTKELKLPGAFSGHLQMRFQDLWIQSLSVCLPAYLSVCVCFQGLTSLAGLLAE